LGGAESNLVGVESDFTSDAGPFFASF